MKTLMRNGRDRRSENPRCATRGKSAYFWLGPISGSHQGPQPQRLHSEAGYMAAPERFADTPDSFPLHRGRRPYMMRNGSRPSIGKPASCHARKERVLVIGTDQRITSGPAATTAAFRGRIHGCTRTFRGHARFFSLAPRAPSIHGCTRTFRGHARFFSLAPRAPSIHASVEKRLMVQHRANEASKRLQSIHGIGMIGASAIAATVTDPKVFRSGRDFAAWIGLVPRQASTGGKQKLGPISKQGDRYLRRILVVGAHSVLRRAKQNPEKYPWLTQLLARRPFKVVAIALANKLARIAGAAGQGWHLPRACARGSVRRGCPMGE